MDISLLRELFTSNGNTLKDKGKREIDYKKFGNKCYEMGIVIQTEDLENKYKEAVKLLISQNPYDIVREKITKEMLFEDFVAKGSKGNDSLIYYIHEGESHFVGAAKDLNPRTLHEIMKSQLYHNLLEKWNLLLKPYSDLLKLNVNNYRELIEMIWESLYSAEHSMRQETVDFSQPPALLEGFGKGAEYIIPFIKKYSILEELNPILKDFLERMEDHKYFCAILASRLIGHNRAYIPWLTGRGGEGKSAFIAFLKLILPRHTASIDISADQPNVSEAIGKTLIIVPDTSKKNIFHYDIVKNISGSDGISINAKYKHPVTLTLPGMIMITSNKMPNIGRYEYAQRRARIFKISKGTFAETDRELSVKDAANEMFKSRNEFLNYCLQCLEELGKIETGFVKMPISQKTKSDKTPEEHSYYDFMESRNLMLRSDLKIKGSELRNLLVKERKDRGEYFQDQFLEYMVKYCNVVEDEKEYIGIGKKTILKEQQIQDAMPK